MHRTLKRAGDSATRSGRKPFDLLKQPKTSLIGRATGPPPQTQRQSYSQVQPTTRLWPFISRAWQTNDEAARFGKNIGSANLSPCPTPQHNPVPAPAAQKRGETLGPVSQQGLPRQGQAARGPTGMEPRWPQTQARQIPQERCKREK